MLFNSRSGRNGGEVGERSLFVCLVGFLTPPSTTRLYRRQAPRQSVWQFYVLSNMRQSWETMTCLSRSHYTDTDPTSRERAATAGIESGTSSPGVARSTDWAATPPAKGDRKTWKWKTLWWACTKFSSSYLKHDQTNLRICEAQLPPWLLLSCHRDLGEKGGNKIKQLA